MNQLRVLVGLRWTMVRSRRVRLGLALLALLFPLLLLVAAAAGQALPPGERAFDILLLAPTLFVAFAALAVIAPLVAGGGNELFPEGQLVAYPVRPATVFVGSLIMAPLNLAWVSQVIVLVGATAAIAERRPQVVLALLTTLAYAALVTVVGQAIAWGVVGLRHTPRGRWLCRVTGGALVLTVAIVVASGRTTDVLDVSPTRYVVVAAIQGSQGLYARWALLTLLLLGLTALAARVGARLCAWTLRSAAPSDRPELQHVVRRRPRRSALSELRALDRASVLRSTSLRRGALVLAVLPGLVAGLAQPSWTSLALLPGLVAAGAGLLFGVNAFCLDGSGAVFVATLPHRPRAILLAKLLVVGETCLLTVLLAVAVAATQVGRLPTPNQALAVGGSILGCTLVVVAVCARLSVERPHKADLRGSRDTPAPPATMAVYSIRLAVVTTWPGLLFAGASASGAPTLSVSVTVLVMALALRSLLRTARRWEQPAARARVVMAVAYG